MNKYAFASAFAVILIVAAAVTPYAATIHGTLINGTTGKPIDGTVIVVNPGSGMMEETEVPAVGGSFSVENLDATAGLYLLRSDYAGVMYTQMVRFEGSETAHATVTVYEQAPSFEGIHVLVPHMAVLATEGHLQIEYLYELHNHIEPAGTVASLDQQFHIFLPEDRIEILRSVVSYNDIPLDRFPVPTDTPGLYRVDYPIRPGDTQVAISFTVPYPDSTYSIEYKLPHAIESMTVYTVNPDMTITSKNLSLGAGESVHGMTAYALSNLEAGSTFDLTVSGGGEINMAVTQGDDPHANTAPQGSTVIIAPNRMENPATLLMAAILLAMLAIIGVTTRGSTNPLDERERLQAFHETLLKRMARLDDLNEAGAVAFDVYKVKRSELKNQIASVIYQLQARKGRRGAAKSRESNAASGAGVAGKERTAQ